jgi:DNA-binding LacI/PurR family transcriptional regulator
MIRCTQCNQVSHIKKAGIVRQKQRYYCSQCQLYFNLDQQPESAVKKTIYTIKDIARELRFSTSTVSKALNNHIDISPEKKALIEAKAKELDYQPNKLARSLKQNRSGVIGLIVPEFTQSFYPRMIFEINKRLSEAGYTAMITQADNRYANEVTNIHSLLASRVEGIIASVTFETTDFCHLQKIIDRQIPLVLFSRYPSQLSCPKIKVDDFEGAYTVVQHLIRQGYKKIGHIGGPNHISVSSDRYKGYRQALADSGLHTSSSWIVQAPDVIEKATLYAHKLLSQPIRPDAIFAFNDPVAIAVVQEAKKLAISIPGQLGLAGFSDDPVSNYITPSITTMRQPIEAIATAIVDNLKRLLLNGYLPENTREQLLQATLVQRESSQRMISQLSL